MTLTLFETIQKIVQEELRQIRTAEIAVVQERHPHAEDSDKDNYACTVELRNSGIVLKQVPVATSRIGTTCLPEVGNTVLVQFIGGDITAPVKNGRRSTRMDNRSFIYHWTLKTATRFMSS
jgi:hypothetical protein